MKKTLKTIFCVLCSAALMAVTVGCGSDGESSEGETTGGAENVSVQAVLESIRESAGDNLDASLFFEDSVFQENCSRLFSIEYSQLSDGGILYCESGEYADEISILMPADGDVEAASQLLEQRKQDRVSVYEGYSPSETEKAQNGVVFTENGCAALVIADNAEDVAEAVREAL